MNLLSLASHELRRVADLVDQMDKIKAELIKTLGSSPAPTKGSRKKRGMSEAGRLAVAAAQKARWAKTKVKSKAKSVVKKTKRTMSASARAKIATAAKARWAKVKAAGKKAL